MRRPSAKPLRKVLLKLIASWLSTNKNDIDMEAPGSQINCH